MLIHYISHPSVAIPQCTTPPSPVMARSLLSLAVTAVSFMTTATNAAVPAAKLTVPEAEEVKTTQNGIIGGPLPLPFPESIFTKTVASVQNTYCTDEYNQPGLKIGDQTLLYTHGDSESPNRANIYHSDSLGIIVAFMGTNDTNYLSELANAEEFGVLPDPALGLPPLALVLDGWQNLWSMSWNAVKASLYQAKQTYPDLPIVVTGHSEGAGIGQLAAMAIAKEFGSESISYVKKIVYSSFG